MRVILASIIMMVGIGISRADALHMRVMVSAQVVPGVYGQVNIGNDAPPSVLYAQPLLIEPQYAPPPPIYLHVPPGHARNWRKHCHEYDACNRPVYFVRSQEYDPEYQRHYDEHRREREMERRRWEERERGDGRGHRHEGDEQGHEAHEQHDNR